MKILDFYKEQITETSMIFTIFTTSVRYLRAACKSN